MAFKQNEIAIVTVNGTQYRDWEMLQVRLAFGEPFDSYKFSVSEGMPLAKDFAAMRIRPGDQCTVTLAGEQAIEGYVVQRQVAYNATQHGVEITGVSKTHALSNGSAISKTGEVRKAPYQSIANQIVKPFGIKFQPVGPLSQKQFERLNIMPGQTAWDTLETLARSRGIELGTDSKSGNLIGLEQWPGGGGDTVIEGINILEGRETMSIDPMDGPHYGAAQANGNDQQWGAKVAHVPFHKEMGQMLGAMGGGQGAYAPTLRVLEHPGDKEDAQSRTKFENTKRGMEQLKAQIVVYGWLRPSGGLWRPPQMVHVKSPMLILDEDLKLYAVTFSQDNRGGTRSTLELKREGGEHKPDVSGKQ